MITVESASQLIDQLSTGLISLSELVNRRVQQLGGSCFQIVTDRGGSVRDLQILLAFYRGDRHWVGINDDITLIFLADLLSLNRQQLITAYQQSRARAQMLFEQHRSSQIPQPHSQTVLIPTGQSSVSVLKRQHQLNQLAAHIRQHRHQLRLTQQQLALTSGFTAGTIRRAEGGQASLATSQKIFVHLQSLQKTVNFSPPGPLRVDKITPEVELQRQQRAYTIRQLRSKLGLSLRKAEVVTGISYSVIRHAEKGRASDQQSRKIEAAFRKLTG